MEGHWNSAQSRHFKDVDEDELKQPSALFYFINYYEKHLIIFE